MRNLFDKELDSLNRQLIEMGDMIVYAIEHAILALKNLDQDLAQEIIRNDEAVNIKEKDIESHCLSLILKQHPVASDLRLVSSALKMITDMERIGDQAADIAEISLHLDREFFIPLVYIPEMSENAIKMVRISIESFTEGDLEKADQVIGLEEEMDRLFSSSKDKLIKLIHENPQHGEEALDLLMIAKYLERIGDHAENISEWVIYSITGRVPNIHS